MTAAAVQAGATRPPPGRAQRWVAPALIALCAAGLAMRAVNFAARRGAYTSGEAFLLPFQWLIGFPGAALLFLLVGMLIVRRRHGAHVIGRLCMLIGIGLSVFDLSSALAHDAPAQIAGWFETLAGFSFSFVISFGLVVLLLRFPTGEYISPAWRGLAMLSALGVCVALIDHVLRADLWVGNHRQAVPNPLYVGTSANAWSLAQHADGISNLEIALLVIAIFGSAASIVVRWRSSDRTTRQQVQWLLLVVGGAAIIFALGLVAWRFNLQLDFWLVFVAAVLVLLIGTPIAIGVAILRHRLFDIDLIWNRALVYGALTGFIVLTYALIVGGSSALMGAQGLGPAPTILATGLIAVLFEPVRRWLQRAANRLIYGQREEPAAVLAELGHILESAASPEAALASIVRALGQSLRLSYAAVALADLDDDARRMCRSVAQWPELATRPPAAMALPLINQAETVGELVVAARPGERFTTRDRQLLDALAHQAAPVAHAALLAGDLQRSRERIVTAREEERRRLRRDLHDGLGPTLAAQTLKLDAALDLLETDPQGARAALLKLKQQTQATVADVRRLVYDLRPPALDELGLAGAVQSFATQLPGPTRVCVDMPPALPQLSAAHEVAAYRICTEALTNVVKHAHATRCDVRLALVAGARAATRAGAGVHDSAALSLTVADDGIGLPLDHPIGIGLRSMRERAEELGGTLTLTSPPSGGTRVEAELPL